MITKSLISILFLLCSLQITEAYYLVVALSVGISSYFYFLAFGTILGTHSCTIFSDPTKEGKSMPLDPISDIVISFGFLLAISITDSPLVWGYILPCAVLSILISVCSMLVYYDYIEINHLKGDGT